MNARKSSKPRRTPQAQKPLKGAVIASRKRITNGGTQQASMSKVGKH